MLARLSVIGHKETCTVLLGYFLKVSRVEHLPGTQSETENIHKDFLDDIVMSLINLVASRMHKITL